MWRDRPSADLPRHSKQPLSLLPLRSTPPTLPGFFASASADSALEVECSLDAVTRARLPIAEGYRPGGSDKPQGPLAVWRAWLGVSHGEQTARVAAGAR